MKSRFGGGRNETAHKKNVNKPERGKETNMFEEKMQAFIKDVLRYINTRINKNSKFLNIQQRTHIHLNGFGFLFCRFQIIVKAISYKGIEQSNPPTNISY